MEKIKIMHIAQSPGGVERYLQMLLRNMNSTKYENILVCSFDYKEENYIGLVSAFEHVDMLRSINAKSDIKAIIAIRKLIKKYSPEIVYMHSSKAGAIGRVANIGCTNIAFYNPHGWAFNMECGFKKTVYRIIEKILAPFCQTIIAISDSEKESAINNRICKSNKIKVIFNGIDVAEYEKKKNSYTITRELLDIPKNAYIIGTVGRLSSQKAPDTFISAAAKIKKIIPQAYFIMVGDGPWLEEVKRMANELNILDSLLITGWVDEPMEYVKLFNQAMLLSRWEGFGLVLTEYMIAKKPIIATKVDAIPNLIAHERNGLLVEKDNIEAVVESSVRLYNDEKFSFALVEEGERLVKEKFDIIRVVKEHESVFCNSMN